MALQARSLVGSALLLRAATLRLATPPPLGSRLACLDPSGGCGSSRGASPVSRQPPCPDAAPANPHCAHVPAHEPFTRILAARRTPSRRPSLTGAVTHVTQSLRRAYQGTTPAPHLRRAANGCDMHHRRPLTTPRTSPGPDARGSTAATRNQATAALREPPTRAPRHRRRRACH